MSVDNSISNVNKLSICLFKSKTIPIDPYELESINRTAYQYQLDYIPVLQYKFKNEITVVNLLQSIITGELYYSGIICTSQRAIQVLIEAIKIITQQQQQSQSLQLNQSNSNNNSNINSITIPLYVVGELSVNYFERQYSIVKSNTDINTELPINILIQQYSTVINAKQLAETIVQLSNSSSLHHPYLILSGNLCRPELFTVFNQNSIKFTNIEVYSTETNTNINNTNSILINNYDWLVLFSPSGINSILESNPELLINNNNIRIACIGPTTATTAIEQYKLPISAIAAKPTPIALFDAIEEAQKKLINRIAIDSSP